MLVAFQWKEKAVAQRIATETITTTMIAVIKTKEGVVLVGASVKANPQIAGVIIEAVVAAGAAVEKIATAVVTTTSATTRRRRSESITMTKTDAMVAMIVPKTGTNSSTDMTARTKTNLLIMASKSVIITVVSVAMIVMRRRRNATTVRSTPNTTRSESAAGVVVAADEKLVCL